MLLKRNLTTVQAKLFKHSACSNTKLLAKIFTRFTRLPRKTFKPGNKSLSHRCEKGLCTALQPGVARNTLWAFLVGPRLFMPGFGSASFQNFSWKFTASSSEPKQAMTRPCMYSSPGRLILDFDMSRQFRLMAKTLASSQAHKERTAYLQKLFCASWA